MPVIRVPVKGRAIKNEQRQALIQQLAKEWAGEPVADGPVIFEIPLEPGDKLDVLVVWEAWKEVPSETRSDVIVEAYKGPRERISQALGVTYQEAVEQHVLPYAVQPMIRPGEMDPAALKELMRRYGGIPLEGGRIDLRFPTMAMAEQAHRKLCDEMPKGYWSIVQSVNPLY